MKKLWMLALLAVGAVTQLGYTQSPETSESAPDDINKGHGDQGHVRKGVTLAQADSRNRPDESELEGVPGADRVPDGQELVNIDFPEPTDIKDIIRAVSIWTGKNVILGRDVSGKVQMISPRQVTKEEAYQAFLSALNLLGLTTVETGKVIKILPVRSAVKGNLKTFMGYNWTPLTDEVITQIVPLRYIDAQQIQTTLARIVSSNSMIAYPPTNTLIISDSGYKVRRILDIIQLLDVQGQQPQLSIVPIRYADAKSIADKVGEIFKATSQGRPGAKSKRSYLSHKIIVDERTNSVVIFGPPRTIADVKALVRRFDVKVDDPSRQATIHVRPLDYADAKKVAATLSNLAQGAKSGRTTLRRPPRRPPSQLNNGMPTPSEPAAVAQFSDDVKITADESSNALLITGSRSAYESINSIIRKLDVRKSQVYVEADILDIVVDGAFNFSTSIFAGSGQQQGNQFAYTWDAKGVGPLIQAQAAKTQTPETIKGAVGAFQSDFVVGILGGYKVQVPGIGEVSPGALIKLIKQDGASKELASPHILTADNEDATITIGEKLYYKTAEISGVSGVSSERIQHEDVNLTLELKANISHTNYVTLSVNLDANTGGIDTVRGVPNISTRKMKQNVTVKNGQTVVISGLMKTTESESYAKIPLLGDLPILGWLFRNSGIERRRTNLMVFLTPNIVHGAEDLAAIYQRKLGERDEFLRIISGSNYEKEDFYRKLPGPSDGEFRPDAFDVLDKSNRVRMQSDLRRDMGYTDGELRSLGDSSDERNDNEEAAEYSADEEFSISVPMGGGGGDEDFGGDMGGGDFDTRDMPPGANGDFELGGSEDFGGGFDEAPPPADIPMGDE